MRKILATATLLAATMVATPASAFAEGSFHVRNETGEPQYCTVRHAGSNYAAPIVLRAEGEWSGTSRTDRPSVLICRGGRYLLCPQRHQPADDLRGPASAQPVYGSAQPAPRRGMEPDHGA